jgi:hypothetical protein
MTAHSPADGGAARYDPWLDLVVNWPEVDVVFEPMAGLLLGELRYPVIALRAGTSAAQRRCTLTHELVHLERGVTDCGPWSAREEAYVEAEVARRLVVPADLERALRELGGDSDLPGLAQLLDVDAQIARTRLQLITPTERHRIRAPTQHDLWSVA